MQLTIYSVLSHLIPHFSHFAVLVIVCSPYNDSADILVKDPRDSWLLISNSQRGIFQINILYQLFKNKMSVYHKGNTIPPCAFKKITAGIQPTILLLRRDKLLEALIEKKKFLWTQDEIKLQVHFEGRLTLVPELNWSTKVLQDGNTHKQNKCQLHILSGGLQVLRTFFSPKRKFIDGFPAEESTKVCSLWHLSSFIRQTVLYFVQSNCRNSSAYIFSPLMPCGIVSMHETKVTAQLQYQHLKLFIPKHPPS